jgi:predicted transcriptional regulator
LSLEEIIKTLTSLGLTNLDSKVYVYNAKHGPLIVEDFVMALKCSSDQICTSLKTLTAKRLVTQKGTVFSAIPFEEALERLIKLKNEQSQFK